MWKAEEAEVCLNNQNLEKLKLTTYLIFTNLSEVAEQRI